MTWVCLMKSKSEVNLLFQNFHKMVCSHNAQVQVLCSDNGGEYLSFELKRYLECDTPNLRGPLTTRGKSVSCHETHT